MRLRFVFFILILIYSCAQQRALTGGEVDGDGPVLDLAVPPNFSTQFNSKTIYLEFDEFIQLNSATSQLVVSPPLEKKPKIELRKKSVTITFKEELKPNTTYTLNFGEGIVDYTEGNVASDLRYVFSTGDELDSLQIKGQVRQAFDNSYAAGYKVMLYKGMDDSLPLLEKPDYIGFTNDSGYFNIQNMSEGDYKVFTLQDENVDFLYDEGESFGFIDNRVVAVSPEDSLSSDIRIYTSTQDPVDQFVAFNEIDSTGAIKMVFNKKPLELEVRVLEYETEDFTLIEDPEEDTVRFFLDANSIRNTEFQIEVSDQGEVLDTLYLHSYEEAFKSVQFNSGQVDKFDGKEDMVLRFNDPLKKIDESKIVLLVDSITEEFNPVIGTEDQRNVFLKGPFKSGIIGEIVLYPGALMSRTNTTNDTISFSFETRAEDYFGALTLNITGIDEILNPLLIIENSSSEIVATKEAVIGENKFDRFEPGTFNVKLISDRNNNGIWDAGDYLNNIQPESVIPFPELIKIRSNWFLDLDWTIQ